MSGAHPFGTMLASDEVIDTIAEIEVQRQTVEKEGGRSAASSGALRRLHELLERERQAQQMHEPSTAHPANIDAVTIEIERVKRLGGMMSGGSIPQGARPGQREVSLRRGTRMLPRNKGRRTMGRASGR